LVEEGATGSRSCADEKPESMSSSMDSRACATPRRATVVLDEEGEMGRVPFALASRAFWALDAKTVGTGSAIPGCHSKLHIYAVIKKGGKRGTGILGLQNQEIDERKEAMPAGTYHHL